MKTGHGLMFRVRVILAIKSEKMTPDPISIGSDDTILEDPKIRLSVNRR